MQRRAFVALIFRLGVVRGDCTTGGSHSHQASRAAGDAAAGAVGILLSRSSRSSSVIRRCLMLVLVLGTAGTVAGHGWRRCRRVGAERGPSPCGTVLLHRRAIFHTRTNATTDTSHAQRCGLEPPTTEGLLLLLA